MLVVKYSVLYHVSHDTTIVKRVDQLLIEPLDKVLLKIQWICDSTQDYLS